MSTGSRVERPRSEYSQSMRRDQRTHESLMVISVLTQKIINVMQKKIQLALKAGLILFRYQLERVNQTNASSMQTESIYQHEFCHLTAAPINVNLCAIFASNCLIIDAD